MAESPITIPWVVVAPGGVRWLGHAKNELDAWSVALGWPDAAEIAHHKQIGWYAVEATVTWQRSGGARSHTDEIGSGARAEGVQAGASATREDRVSYPCGPNCAFPECTCGVPASGLTRQLRRAAEAGDEGHAWDCLAILRGKSCSCGLDERTAGVKEAPDA